MDSALVRVVALLVELNRVKLGPRRYLQGAPKWTLSSEKGLSCTIREYGQDVVVCRFDILTASILVCGTPKEEVDSDAVDAYVAACQVIVNASRYVNPGRSEVPRG